MPKIDLNQSPYFDDYNENKKFYKILFRPGRAVQARELTQIQTALQKQIERMGQHIFEQGSQVLPGSKEGVRYINNNGFIKIPDTSFANNLTELNTYWLNKEVIGANGVRAKVIGVREADSIFEARLYLNYLGASSNGLQTAFAPGETIQTDELNPISATIPGTTYSTGQISSVIVEEGVYFFDGNFILVDQQTIFITPQDTEDQSTWNNQPTASVGLRITESIVTSDDDESLLDNAIGSPNYAAPGADRLHISADLIQVDLNNTDSDFIPLLKVLDGVVQARVIRTEYSVLEDTLARRTNDESGDYSVVPFQIQIKDFLRDDINNGIHNEKEFYFQTIEEALASSITTFGIAAPGLAYYDFDRSAYMPGTSYNGITDSTSFIQLCNDRLSIKIDPGKAYVKGYEIEKLGTTIIDVLKARTLRFRNNKTISTPLGTFLYVTNLYGALDIESYDDVELHASPITSNGSSPGNKIGTARVLAVEFFSGVNGSSTGIYRLFVFDMKADPGKTLRQLKSIYSSNMSFTCDCVTQNFRLVGSVAAQPNKLIGTGTSWKNDELQRLQAGDYVQVAQGPDSKIYRVLNNPSNDNELDVTPDPTLDNWPDGSTIDYAYVLPETNSQNAGLLYSLPDDVIYTLRGGQQDAIDFTPSGIDTTYTARVVLGTNEQTVADKLVFTVSGSLEFEDFNTTGYAVINLSNGDWLELIPYVAGTPAAGKCEVEALGSQITFHLNSVDANGGLNEFYVIGSVIYSGGLQAAERSKTLIKGDFTSNPGIYSGASVVTSGSDVAEISLGQADVLRITRIVESKDYSTEPSNLEVLPPEDKDITGLYILDDGQRDYYYDIASVKLRPGVTKPRGKVRVEFDYFEHGTSGNYFSVDSYPFKGPQKKMEYEEIPVYVASDGTEYDLASVVDFRPRVNLGGVTSGFATSLQLPKENLRCDYHFYEGRIDKLFLDKSGRFLVKSGIPDVKPQTPDEPETGMVIYELDFAPYTALPQSVFPRFRDNKRYTMRDIGKLEKRISNLEYYTTLSLLEVNTKELKITDAQGNDKFKNGFLVDNFSTFNGDLGSDDYKAAIDRSAGTARPIITQQNTALFEKILLESNINEQNALRFEAKYQKTGDIFTLPYDPVVFLEQKKASKIANVNPYAVFTFVGSVSITPWSDEWRETKNLEPLNVVDSGAYEAAQKSFGPTGTTIDYTSTSQMWLGSKTESTKVGEVIKVGGHQFYDDLPKKEKKQLKRDIKKGKGTIVVPEGYANSGETVPAGRSSLVSDLFRNTVTLTGQQIVTSFTSTFVDQGFSSPVSLGSRIVETAMAEFMREREITFNAKAFMPFARLYPFFDDVDVSEDCKPDGGNYGDDLICDSKGRLKGTFKIPNRQGKKFKVGDRIFRLTTSPNNQKNPPPASAGEGRYTARGWIDVQQETTYSTRLYTVEKGSTTTSSEISLQVSETFSEGKACPRDPIAQSFFVYDNGGCFITAVDVFFYKKPTGSSQPPITLQIRPLDDGGNPSNKVLPFGEVIKEAAEIITNKVDLVNGTLTVVGYDNSDPQIPANSDNSGPWPSDNVTNASGKAITSGTPVGLGSVPADDMIPTRFTFESPIYLSQNESYCFVLISDSDEYNVWVAQSGPDITGREGLDAFRDEGEVNTEIGTDTPILKDPYIQGVFFKSQNGISWTADQTIDMKFSIWKADFDTSVNGEIEFVNEELPLKKLTLDPIETKVGSSRVRILHPNHGLTVDTPASKVVFQPNYDIVLAGTLTSTGSNIIGVGTQFNLLAEGGYIQHPLTGEQKKIVTITNDTSLVIDGVFTSLQLSSTPNVRGTTFALPDGTSLNGFNSSVLFDYNGHDVLLSEMDYYIIDLGVNATTSGRVGGPQILASENRRYEELLLLTTPLELPETNIAWNVQTTSSAGVNDLITQPYLTLPRKNIFPNEKFIFDRPMQISSYINERSINDVPPGPAQVSPELGGQKSLNVRAVLKSSNRNLSPIIDTSRMSVYTIAHRLDDPRGVLDFGVVPSQVINDVFDDYQCVPTNDSPIVSSTANLFHFSTSTGALSGLASGTSGSITVTGDINSKFLSELRVGSKIKISSTGEERIVRTISADDLLTVDLSFGSSFGPEVIHTDPANVKIKTANANAAKHISKLDIGKYVSVSGATGERNVTDRLITSVEYIPNNTVNDVDLGAPKLAEIEVDYRSLTAAGIETNEIIITQKDRYIDEIAPAGGSCAAKYVSKKLVVPRESNSLKVMFDAHRHESCQLELYYKLEPVNSDKHIDKINWTKAEFNLDINGVLQPAIPDPNDNVNEFNSYEATLNDLPGFVGAQVKIVMRGGNPARPPLIRNFRLIGLDE